MVASSLSGLSGIWGRSAVGKPLRFWKLFLSSSRYTCPWSCSLLGYWLNTSTSILFQCCSLAVSYSCSGMIDSAQSASNASTMTFVVPVSMSQSLSSAIYLQFLLVCYHFLVVHRVTSLCCRSSLRVFRIRVAYKCSKLIVSLIVLIFCYCRRSN